MNAAERAALFVALVPLFVAGWTAAQIPALLEVRLRVQRAAVRPWLDGLKPLPPTRAGYLAHILPVLAAEEWSR